MMNASALPARYGIGKTLFYQRRNYLISLGYNLEPEKDGNERKYSDEQVQLLDELDKYVRDNGGMEGFPSVNVHEQFAEVHPSSELTIPPGDHPETETKAVIESESVQCYRDPRESQETNGVNIHQHSTEIETLEIPLSSTNGHTSNSVQDATELTQTNPEPSAEIDGISPETLNEQTLVHPSPEPTKIESTESEENQVDKNQAENLKEQQLPSNINVNPEFRIEIILPDEARRSEFKPKKMDMGAFAVGAPSVSAGKLARRSALYLGGKQKESDPNKSKQRERHILKLFLALQVTGLITGAVLASAARLDLLTGMGLGLGLGSVNFGVSLTLSSRD